MIYIFIVEILERVRYNLYLTTHLPTILIFFLIVNDESGVSE
jgi:hypothetical protein